MKLVWQRAGKSGFNEKLVFKEWFLLMICTQVTNAVKDDMSPVIQTRGVVHVRRDVYGWKW